MRSARPEAGRALLALVSGLAGLGLLLGATLGLGPFASVCSTTAAARALAAQMRACRVEAYADGHSRAVVFPLMANEPYVIARDGDGDGLRRADLALGIDTRGPASSLARDYPGIRIASPPWPAPALPSGQGVIGLATPALRFGRARLVAFTADGRATPGSLFVTDGRQTLCAVVVTGATARTRVYCLDRRAARWRLR